MLGELQGHRVVDRVVLGQSQRDAQHAQAVERHPCGAVGLFQPAAGWQLRAVDRAHVVQAQESALEDVVALGVHAVDPPGEVHQQLLEDLLQEVVVLRAVDLEDPQGGPRVDRRVDVAEVPLVRGQCTVGVHVPLAAHEQQLVLGVAGIDVCEHHRVEGEIPRREPGVLPGVRHRDHVVGVHLLPGVVAPFLRRWRRGLARIAGQPALDVVAVELLGPDHPGERRTHSLQLRPRAVVGGQIAVELVGFGLAGGEQFVEVPAEGVRIALVLRRLPQPQADLLGRAGGYGQPVPPGAFGAAVLRVDAGFAEAHVPVDPVLGVGGDVLGSEDQLIVGLVVAQHRRRCLPVRQRTRVEMVGP